MKPIIYDTSWLYEAFEKVEALYIASIKEVIYSDCTAEELAKAANYDQWEVRVAVSLNPNTSIQTLQRLAKDPDIKVRAALAANEDTPKKILKILEKDKRVGVRRLLAQNPNTPTDTLDALINDKSYKVRWAIVNSPYMPEEILRKLSKSHGYHITSELAANPATPLDVLLEMIKSGSANARDLVLNPKIPTELFKQHFPKESLSVYNLALAARPDTDPEYLKLLFQYQSGHDGMVNGPLAENPSTPPDVLKMISEDSLKTRHYLYNQGRLKLLVARNPNISKDHMKELSIDSDIETRCYLAMNPSINIETINILSTDNSVDVRISLACNPKTPVAILEQFILNKSSILLTVVSTVAKQRRSKI